MTTERGFLQFKGFVVYLFTNPNRPDGKSVPVTELLNMRKFPAAGAALMLFVIAARAQDTADAGLAKTKMEAVYHQSVGQQRLYNGTQHTGYSPTIKGHAYYHTRDWQNGAVWYEGIHYANVPMIYDVYKDQLVIRHPNEIFIVGLVSTKVSSFSLGEKQFVRIDTGLAAGMQPGFYEVLANGGVMALARRVKTMREFIDYTSNRMNYEFMDQHKFYLKKDGTYHAIRSEARLLDVLHEERAQVKQFLRKQNLRFKNGAEQAIVQAVNHYSSLKK